MATQPFHWLLRLACPIPFKRVRSRPRPSSKDTRLSSPPVLIPVAWPLDSHTLLPSTSALFAAARLRAILVLPASGVYRLRGIDPQVAHLHAF